MKIWIIDNTGFISGPLNSTEEAEQELESMVNDRFEFSGNVKIVEVLANCDNYIHNGHELVFN